MKKRIYVLLPVLMIPIILGIFFVSRHLREERRKAEYAAAKLEFEDISKPLENVIFDDSLGLYTDKNLPEEYLGEDFDNDGLDNAAEIEYGTDMYNPDSDGDGATDLSEIKYGTDPNTASNSDLVHCANEENPDFEPYYTLDNSGFMVSIKNPADEFYLIEKTECEAFDDYSLMSNIYKIYNFDGSIGLNMKEYLTIDDYSSIGILVYSGNTAQDTPYTVEDRVLWFSVNRNDIFAVYYIEK
jgi:hypothetical protein